jgi:hypothetical protein
MTTKTPTEAVLPTQTELYEDVLHLAYEQAIAYLAGLDSEPAAATADVHALRRQLGRPLEERGVAAEQVIADLVADVEGGLVGSAGGRFRRRWPRTG